MERVHKSIHTRVITRAARSRCAGGSRKIHRSSLRKAPCKPITTHAAVPRRGRCSSAHARLRPSPSSLLSTLHHLRICGRPDVWRAYASSFNNTSHETLVMALICFEMICHAMTHVATSSKSRKELLTQFEKKSRSSCPDAQGTRGGGKRKGRGAGREGQVR